MNDRQLLYFPGNPVAEVSGSSGAVMIPFRRTRKSRLLIVLALAVTMLELALPSYGQTIFNCPSGFSSSGACGFSTSTGQPFKMNSGQPGAGLAASSILMIPTATTHVAVATIYQTVVNVQAFSAAFTFVPNGDNIAFVLQNTNNQPGWEGPLFVAGAGCEAGFYQTVTAGQPNNIFALEFDSVGYVSSGGPFVYSTVQYYTAGQCPCDPNDGDPNWAYIPKISTYPVPLNSPAASQLTSTGDTYSATLNYNGSSLTLSLYDVTAGGSCPGVNCFTNTWTNVNIPSLVGGNTAYVGFTGAVGLESIYPLYLKSASYTVESPGQKPTAPTALTGTLVTR